MIYTSDEREIFLSAAPYCGQDLLEIISNSIGSKRAGYSIRKKCTTDGFKLKINDINLAIESISKCNAKSTLKKKAIEALKSRQLDSQESGYHLTQDEELKALRRRVKDLERTNALDSAYGSILKSLFESKINPPKWTTYKPKNKTHCAIPSLLVSDGHFDEVVFPDEVRGVNEYNREIAISRLFNLRNNTIKLLRSFLSGVSYEGIILPLAGDFVSGMIHEELERTNEESIIPSCLFWSEQMMAFIGSLADEFGKAYVPCVVGNHGRMDKKPQAKNAVVRNFEYLLYKLIENHFKNDSRVTVDVSRSTDMLYKIYNTNYLLMHGDDFKGGSGISGAWSPLKLGEHRLSQQFSSLGDEYTFDIVTMGHFHRRMIDEGLIVNGSIKGYDEYAKKKKFKFQPPQQCLWLTTPERGKTFEAPVFCD